MKTGGKSRLYWMADWFPRPTGSHGSSQWRWKRKRYSYGLQAFGSRQRILSVARAGRRRGAGRGLRRTVSGNEASDRGLLGNQRYVEAKAGLIGASSHLQTEDGIAAKIK